MSVSPSETTNTQATAPEAERAEGVPYPPTAAPARGPSWPAWALLVVFRPGRFYRRQVRHVGHGQALAGVGGYSLVSVLVAMGFVVADEGLPPMRHWWEPLLMLAMILGLACGGIATVGVGGVIFSPAISGAATFGQAYRRSLAIVATTTAVYPIITFLVALAVWYAVELERAIESLLGVGDGEVVIIAGVALLGFWPFGLLIFALSADRPGPGEDSGRDVGRMRCEGCGYDLRVLPEEGVCPECGLAAEASLDPLRRRRPAPEVVRRDRGAALRRAQWAALWRPTAWWWGRRVRCDVVTARNGWLLALLLNGPVPAALFVLGMAFASLADSRTHFDGALVAGVCMVLGTWVGLLVVNHLLLLVAIAAAMLDGVGGRFEELARLGYYAAGWPLRLQLVCWSTFLMALVAILQLSDWMWRNGSPGASRVADLIGQVVMTLIGLAAAGVCLWLVVSAVRAMRATRYANS